MTRTSVDISGAINKINTSKDAVLAEADVMIEQLAEIGIKAAREKLDASITRSGVERMSRGVGNSAGRNLTGAMINSLRNLGPTLGSSGKIKLWIGWNPDSYFKFQELGTSGRHPIPAAHSLRTGRRTMQNELPRLARNMIQRIRRKGL